MPIPLNPCTVKKPCRNAPNSDVDNGGSEPKGVGVGIFRPQRRLVRTTVVHIGISRSFFTVWRGLYLNWLRWARAIDH
jgi:hypothetical protein